MNKRDIIEVITFYQKDPKVAADVLRSMHVTETHKLRSALGSEQGRRQRAEQRYEHMKRNAQDAGEQLLQLQGMKQGPLLDMVNDFYKEMAMLRYEKKALEDRIVELEAQHG